MRRSHKELAEAKAILDTDPLAAPVCTALGTASVCWRPAPEGVFDDEEALIVAHRLIVELREKFTITPKEGA